MGEISSDNRVAEGITDLDREHVELAEAVD